MFLLHRYAKLITLEFGHLSIEANTNGVQIYDCLNILFRARILVANFRFSYELFKQNNLRKHNQNLRYDEFHRI